MIHEQSDEADDSNGAGLAGKEPIVDDAFEKDENEFDPELTEQFNDEDKTSSSPKDEMNQRKFENLHQNLEKNLTLDSKQPETNPKQTKSKK